MFTSYQPIVSQMSWSTILYFATILMFIVSLVLQGVVNGSFNKHAKVRNARGMTGLDAARTILNANGIFDVQIEAVRGILTDHYDSRAKVIRLSEPVYGTPSISAVAVAAHECGHAIQHANGYFPIVLRNKLLPAANIGSRFGICVFFLGLLFSFSETLMTIGIIMFTAAVLFHVITLPIEFDASRRGIAALESAGILQLNEISGAKKVLTAAAMTYVAAAASSMIQLLRLIAIRDRR